MQNALRGLIEIIRVLFYHGILLCYGVHLRVSRSIPYWASQSSTFPSSSRNLRFLRSWFSCPLTFGFCHEIIYILLLDGVFLLEMPRFFQCLIQGFLFNFVFFFLKMLNFFRTLWPRTLFNSVSFPLICDVGLLFFRGDVSDEIFLNIYISP